MTFFVKCCVKLYHFHVLKTFFAYTCTKGCTRLIAASDRIYKLLAHGQWFSPGTPASSITKTDRHDIAEILLKVALNPKNQIKSNHIPVRHTIMACMPPRKSFLSSFYILVEPVIVLSITEILGWAITPHLTIQATDRLDHT